MRIVSLGLPMPDPQVDNHSIANAPSLFEYDACVLDPRIVSEQIEAIAAGSRDLTTPEGVPVQAGSTGAFHYGLGELLQQRRREIQRLLERGGVAVVFAYPNVPHPSVATLPGADRYCILPAPADVLYRPPQLVTGDGKTIRSQAPQHPFAPYLDHLAGKLRYRAHWEATQIPNFDRVATVFGHSAGGAVIALAFRVTAGHVVFLPPPTSRPSGTDRRLVTDALLECIQRMLEHGDEEHTPTWLHSYALPDVAPAQVKFDAAKRAAAEAEQQFIEACASLNEAQKYQGLLWQGTAYALQPLARDAFRAIGFSVTPDLNQPADLRDDDTIALLEIDASNETVSERSYLALQRRIEADFLRSGVRRKGIIVANGERLVDPATRAAPFSATLVNACETFGYALISGDALFALVRYAIEGAEVDTLAGIRETILTTDGMLEVREDEEPAKTVAEEPARSELKASSPATD